jgi:hypothetical protein
MRPDEADDWLMVAVKMVRDLPEPLFRDAAELARQTCTHHAHIVPTILEYAMPRTDQYIPRPEPAPPASSAPRIERPAYVPDPPPPMTQADVDTMIEPLRKIGLGAGWLTTDADGRMVLA